jgi:hypothetical protein
MSEMIVDKSSSVPQAAPPKHSPRPSHTLLPRLTDTPIQVTVVNPHDDRTVALHIPMDQLYLRVPEEFNGQIEWTLTGAGGTETPAIWDNPSIVFSGNVSVAPVVSNNRKTVTIIWANTDPGVSFTYTMNALIEIGGHLIPIRHDPTVHNEPPTI